MKKHLVIVGGGFAGIKLARSLARKKLYTITLISDKDTFSYYPELYKAATGYSDESAMPVTDLLGNMQDLVFVHAKAEKIDRKARTITTEDKHVFKYDYAVFALGVVTNYFGIPGLAEFSENIKTTEQLHKFRHDIHEEFMDNKRPDRDYVVVGAGATGVELAGAMRSYLVKVAQKHGVAHPHISLKLVEASPRVLGRMSEKAGRRADGRLRKLGVDIMTSAKMESVSDKGAVINGKEVPSQIIIWTAGVSNNPFFEANKDEFPFGGHGRIAVNEYLQVDRHVYVLGDNADTQYGGLALTAVRDAAYLAKSFTRLAHGQAPRPYKQKKPITVIPVGTGWALVEWYGFVFGGLLGSLLRVLGDIKGYMDIMPWRDVAKTWFKSEEKEEDCPICNK
jgi:NADH:ubiquinone reductase (H+-translocating)